MSELEARMFMRNSQGQKVDPERTIGPLISYKVLSIHLQTTKGKAPQRVWGRTVSAEGGEMRVDNECQDHLCFCIGQKTVTGGGT